MSNKYLSKILKVNLLVYIGNKVYRVSALKDNKVHYYWIARPSEVLEVDVERFVDMVDEILE